MSGDNEAGLRTRDAAARRIAQSEFERPIVLEAGAGTGKTATLVARVLAWSLGPGWQRAENALRRTAGSGGPSAEQIAARVLGGVVAITFTDAAAAEMAQRVDDALDVIESGELPIGAEADCLPDAALRRERGRALRGELDHLVVQTIHAYCWRLLGAHPLQAGLHPELEVDEDGRESAATVREVVERSLGSAYLRSGNGAAFTLAAAGYGPFELERELTLLLTQGVSAAAFRDDPLAPERARAECERLRGLVENLHGEFAEALGAIKRTVKPAEVLRTLERTREHLVAYAKEPGELGALLDALRECWDDSLIARLKDWGKLKLGKSEMDVIGDRAARLAELSAALRAPLEQWRSLDVELFRAAREVIGDLLAQVEDAMRRKGKITFAGLLIAAADLVKRNPDVARRLRGQIEQILVDEFQDTDHWQCALVESLALAGAPAERPGLFIVGDPKQSIYGWRSADLAAYEAFVARVLAAGGEKHPLTVNYRSVPGILREVGRVIEPVMQQQAGLQPAFEPLVACPDLAAASGFDRDRFAAVEYWLSADANDTELVTTSSGRATQLEALALAADLRRLHDVCGVAWGDIAVLFRSRGDWEIYLGALREAQIPFAVGGDRSYYRRREIIEAAALVRYVIDANDHLALLTLLRCSAVGVPDAALVPLWRGRLPALLGALGERDPALPRELRAMIEGVAAALPDDVPGLARVHGWERNLLAAADAIAVLRRSFEEDPADVFVEKLRTRLLFEAGEAARFLGLWRAANLDRFFQDLSKDLADARDMRGILRRLRSAVSDEEPTEEAQPRDLAPDSVHVMTLHGAKGLGFEHVYLMQLHKGAASHTKPSSEIGEVDAALELRLFGSASLGWDRVRASKDLVEEAESVRTLYVAMTRAKQRLVVAGLWPGFQGHGKRPALIDLVAQRNPAPPDFASAFSRCLAAGARDFEDAAGARFVFTARRAADSKAGAAVPATADFDLGRVRADAEWLRAERLAAEVRMARSFTAKASQRAHEDDAGAQVSSGMHARRAGGGAADAELARVAGTAVHRLLETLALDADPDAELVAQCAHLEGILRPHVAAERLADAVRATRERALKLRTGKLLRRLYDLREHIVARELPVLLAAGSEDPAAEALSGTIDLVYRDPASAEWVIVDYKTDDVGAGGDEALAEKTRGYAEQGAVYQRAIRDAFGLGAMPRFELWYLSHDRCVSVSE